MSDLQKKNAGEAAAAHVEAGMIVGLGTGSTAAWFVKALAARNLSGLRCVPTSEKTADLARDLGLTLSTLEDTPRIDLTVDGADEVGPGLALIKGGGAALLREKLVWEASTRCIVIADAAKVVPVLGDLPPADRGRRLRSQDHREPHRRRPDRPRDQTARPRASGGSRPGPHRRRQPDL